jgi:GNAT superfamily N-acetyltransferase
MEYKLVDLEQGDISSLDSIKPDNWSSIRDIHRHYLESPGCHSIKAISPSCGILGIGTGIVFGKTAWLAHIIVCSAHQKKGIGSRIVGNLIEHLQNGWGCRSISLTATDQGYPVYKKAGFSEESLYRVMIKPQEPSFPERDIRHVVPIEPRHLESVFRIDQSISGEVRKEFLGSVLRRGYVYEDEGRVLGFYLPDFGDGGVSAVTEEAGFALLRERIERDGSIFIPEENGAGYEYLLSSGYKEVKKIHRMIMGEAFVRKPEYCYARIGGFAG